MATKLKQELNNAEMINKIKEEVRRSLKQRFPEGYLSSKEVNNKKW